VTLVQSAPGQNSSDDFSHYSSSQGEFKFKEPARFLKIGDMVKKETSAAETPRIAAFSRQG
jgi:hypothetical protein